MLVFVLLLSVSVCQVFSATTILTWNTGVNGRETFVLPGDIVVWNITDGALHTVTSDVGAPASFDSGFFSPPANYTLDTGTIPQGSYPYHCNVHGFSMNGILTVSTTNTSTNTRSLSVAPSVAGTPSVTVSVSPSTSISTVVTTSPSSSLSTGVVASQSAGAVSQSGVAVTQSSSKSGAVAASQSAAAVTQSSSKSGAVAASQSAAAVTQSSSKSGAVVASQSAAVASPSGSPSASLEVTSVQGSVIVSSSVAASGLASQSKTKNNNRLSCTVTCGNTFRTCKIQTRKTRTCRIQKKACIADCPPRIILN